MTFPAVLEAERDPRLRGMPIILYKRLLDRLDFHDWIEVKQASLAAECQVSEDTIERAMRRLVSEGYVERGGRRFQQAREYRLRKTRAAAKAS